MEIAQYRSVPLPRQENVLVTLEADMGSAGRVLVVDDSDESRRILADILGMLGYSVSTASDGERAWILLQQAGLPYDLVITDFMMPRLNGIELLAKIMAQHSWMKVVLISGHLDQEVTSKAQKLGAFAVLPKPCGIEALSGTVKLAMVKSTGERGGEINEKADDDFDGARPCHRDVPQCGIG
jgi:DNA-binding NtrC family response regulator